LERRIFIQLYLLFDRKRYCARQYRRGRSTMDNLTLRLPVFMAGVAVGALVTSLLPRLWNHKKRRMELREARARILTGIKEKHEQEMLREIFQAKDALYGELSKSLNLLRDSAERLLGEVKDERHPTPHSQA
jgi:uncharacterized membrane-anchored protein YhcB (DUF1043 family)